MDTQFTASEHLMTLDISPKNVYSFIVWSGTRNLYLRKSMCFRLELV